MGLDVSHDAFSGAYSAFNRLRQIVAKSIGGSFPPHENKSLGLDENSWYWGLEHDPESTPGIAEFMSHSDCDGEISPEVCVQIADELEALLPKIAEVAPAELSGHVARAGGYVEVVIGWSAVGFATTQWLLTK